MLHDVFTKYNNTASFSVRKFPPSLSSNTFILVSLYINIIYYTCSFAGISIAEAAKLCSYMHLRDAESIADKSLLQKADMDMSIDFLDPIDEDIPKGMYQHES